MTFESGVKQGKRFIRYLRALSIATKQLSEFKKVTFGCSEKQAVYYWRTFPKHKPTDALHGFIRTIIPDRFVEYYGTVRMMPFEQLIQHIEEEPPFCHFSKDLGFAGFALHEADTWVFDLNDGSVSTIDIGEYRTTYVEISAGVSDKVRSVTEWLDYLVKEAVDRQWLTPDSLSDLA